jgi:hypothetical protein
VQLRTLRRIQRVESYSAPLAVLLIGSAHAWHSHFAPNVLAAASAALFVVVPLGFALRNRSQGKEAAFFYARITVDPAEAPEDHVDIASPDVLFAVIGVAFVLAIALFPLLRS